MTPRHRLALLALALLLPATALADPKDDARRHFVAGLEAAKEGDFEVSLQRFLAAQEAYPHPATLYNIAKAYTDLKDYPNALTYYRLYSDAAPDKADDVAQVVAVLEARLNQESPRATPPTAPVGVPGAGGPSEQELARLDALTAELEALTAVFRDRAARGVAAPPEPPPDPDEPLPPEDELPDLGEDFISDAYQRVVVTASRYGQEPIDSPSTVTIITAEDVRLSGATNVPDLLRQVVGVEVMSLTASQSDVSIRGFNNTMSNKVLVLVDGRSTYLDSVGTTVWELVPLTMSEIDRIEVIRGPGSAVYGANAVTGVINIITRTPGEGDNVVLFEGGLQGDSLGYGRGEVLATGRAGGTGYRFAAQLKQLGRWNKDADLESASSLSSWFANQDVASRTVKASGRLDWTFLDEGFASASGGYVQGHTEFYALGVLGDYFLDESHHFLRGDIAYGPAHLRAFWNHDAGTTGPWLEATDVPRSLVTDIDVDTVDLEIEAHAEFETGPVAHRLNGGLGYRYKAVDFGYLEGDGVIAEHHENAFLSEEASWERLKVVGTFRVDSHPLIPISKTLSPRGAAIFRLQDTTSIRVTGGSSFRAPNFIESYLELDLNSGVDGVFIRDYGDEDLSPERILTAEVGVHDESTLYHHADLALYVNRVTDVIGLRSVEPALGFYDEGANGFLAGTSGFSNLEPTYTGYGAEIEAELFPMDGLDVHGNVAVESITEATEAESVRDGSTSLVKVNAGVMYRAPFNVDLSAGMHYVSPQTWRMREFDSAGQLFLDERSIPARLIVTARVAVRPFEERFELAANVWNATAFVESGRFQEHPNGQYVGSLAYATVSYRF